MNTAAAAAARQVAADPVTQALIGPLEQAVRNVLDEHLPKLTLTRAEAAELLGVSTTTVDQFLAAGQLDRIAAGRITLASALRLAGWPIESAPLASPLSTVPVAS